MQSGPPGFSPQQGYPQQPGYPPQQGNPQPGPQGYGYGPPPGGYGIPPQGGVPSPLVQDVRSIATITIVFLGLRAALPLVLRVLSLASVRLSPALYEWPRTVLGLVALIFYFVWFARFYAWVRAAKGGTSYSTGLAIGGWFIPFGNLVLPVLALNDAWKRAHDGQGSPLVILWWLAYLGCSFLGVFFSLISNPQLHLHIGEGMGPMINAAGWVNLVSQIVAYGLWAMIVRQLTEQAR